MRPPLARHVAIDRLPIAVVCSLLVVLAGCGGVPPTKSSNHPTATRQPPLAWHAITLPQGIDVANEANQHTGVVLAISPVDGHDAWLCVPATGGSFAIWATTDTGTRWRQVGSFTPNTPLPPTCGLMPDQLDPNTLAAGLSWGAGADGTDRAAAWLSNDGGATWHAVPGEMAVGGIATRNGTTYALLEDTSPGLSARPGQGIAISTDGLRTWRVVHPGGTASDDIIFQFWLNPTLPELVAATEDNALWHSVDGGATWTQLSAPNVQITLGAWIPTERHWLLCGNNPASPMQLLCSIDLGATWVPRPVLADTYTCTNCGKWGAPSGGTQPCGFMTVAPDGALLTVCPPTGTVPAPTNLALYSLAPGSSTWVTLGAAPGPWLNVPSTGPLWCGNAETGSVSVTSLPNL